MTLIPKIGQAMKILHPAIPVMQHIVSVIRPFLSGKPASLSNSMLGEQTAHGTNWGFVPWAVCSFTN